MHRMLEMNRAQIASLSEHAGPPQQSQSTPRHKLRTQATRINDTLLSSMHLFSTLSG